MFGFNKFCTRNNVVLFQKINFSMKRFQKSPNYEVVFITHGKTDWNSLNLFTGWYDSRLTKFGQSQAAKAGKLLKREGYYFDLAYTSELCRAKETLRIIMKHMEQCPPTVNSWKLNEKHTGALTGMNEDDMERMVGKKQVDKWRYDFNELPPLMDEDHEHYECICSRSPIKPPPGESLKMLSKRIVEYWTQMIVPEMKKRKRILIVSNENAYKVLLKHLDPSMPQDLRKMKIAQCLPFSYTFNFHMEPIRSKKAKFLGDSVAEIENARDLFKGNEIKKRNCCKIG